MKVRLMYDGSSLVWLNTGVKRWDARFAGKKAGAVRRNGYVSVNIGGKMFYEHRLVWLIFFGPIRDGLQIDHINHNRGDNRILNLRLCCPACNAKNLSMNSTNRSGHNGVSFDSERGLWRSYVTVQGSHINIGRFADIESAISARNSYNSALGFHVNHGEVK